MPSTRGFFSVLAVSVCAIALAASTASAATVTNTNDAGPGSLRQAVIDAAPGETITVPAGTYSLSSGEIAIEKSLTLAGNGAATTTVRSGGVFRVFAVAGAGNQVTISGLTIRDGRLTGGGASQGAGVLNNGAVLTLRDVVVTANVIDTTSPGNSGGIAQGAGVASSGPEGTRLTIIGSTIANNTGRSNGDSGKAGGIVQGGGVFATSEYAIEGSTISGNLAEARGGQGPSSSSQGGGIVQGGGVFGVSPTPTALRTSTLSGNSGDVRGGPGGSSGIAQGGGMFAIAAKAADLTELTVTANVVRLGTGGIAQGGGLFALASPPENLTYTSSTIAANGIEGTSGSQSGGNVFYGAGVRFANTIVAAGFGAPGSENCEGAGEEGKASLGFNLDSLDQCEFHSGGDLVNKDPQLGPLQNNGGPTATLLPAVGSPVVDQGAAFGLGTDQRGVQRPIDFPTIPNAPGGDGSDIGAVELQPSNQFGFGKLTKNKKKGTARLVVNLPTPNVGIVTLSGKGLKPRTVAVNGTTSSVTFVVAAESKKLKKALRKKGKRKVGIAVTYAPTGNATLTQVRKAKLVKKKAKHRKGKPKAGR